MIRGFAFFVGLVLAPGAATAQRPTRHRLDRISPLRFRDTIFRKRHTNC
jgi:hypothetical protein